MSETYVLINGAWHGGWAWRPVAQHLRAAGHRVLTPTLPGLADGADPTAFGLPDVVDFLVDLVERGDAPEVTLVGHSWGGYPMTAAANRLGSRVRKAVYWSAFVPAAGANLLDEVPPPYVELFEGVAAASGNGSVALPFEVFAGGFIQDAPEPVQRLVHDLLVPQPCSTSPRPSSRCATTSPAPTCCPPRTSRCRPASTPGRRASPSGSG